MKKYLKGSTAILLMSMMFLWSCEKDGTDDVVESGSGAKVQCKVELTEAAHECITQTYGEKTIILVVLDPNGKETYRKGQTIKAYNATTSAYEVDVTISGFSEVGTYKFHIYDEAGTWEYDSVKSQIISSSDVENGKTESVFWAVRKSEAGC